MKFLSNIRRDVTECVGAALVDIERGTLLGSDTQSEDEASVCELAAAAAPDLLAMPDSPEACSQLAIVAHDRLHVWLRASSRSPYALLVLCRVQANLGAVLAKSRTLRPSLAAVAA